jgi:hypothetical protein
MIIGDVGLRNRVIQGVTAGIGQGSAGSGLPLSTKEDDGSCQRVKDKIGMNSNLIRMRKVV